MPELPEVETIKNDVRRYLLGRRIEAVDLLDPALVRRPQPEEFVARLVGTSLASADRVGKYLIIGLGSGDSLVLQLAITGQLLLAKPGAKPVNNDKLVCSLDDGKQVRMNDANGYAKAQLQPKSDLTSSLGLDKLGPDPTAADFTPTVLQSALRRRRGKIKPLLLDQHFLAGLGNIYADEALFRAGIHPAREANTLSPAEQERLYAAIREVLLTGIAKRGTTIATYRDLLGRKGHYQEELKVFRRTGKPCAGCAGVVEMIRMGGRDTHYCPACQK